LLPLLLIGNIFIRLLYKIGKNFSSVLSNYWYFGLFFCTF
jgi:hypothetical protein